MSTMRISILIAVQILSEAALASRSPKAGFIALDAHDSNWRPKASESAADCDLACGEDAPKNCVTDCNSAVYQCINVANTSETQKCRKDILKGIKRIRSISLRLAKRDLQQVPNKTLADNTTILAADRKLVRNDCAAACGDNVNSSCVTSCEMEMYACIDHTLPHEVAEGKREECFKKVLEKYKGFKEEWNATHGLVARHDAKVTTAATLTTKNETKNVTAHYTVTQEDMKMIKDVCNAACTKAGGGAPSSMCITHCETDMYRCIKETLPNEMDERKQCRKDTQAKYETWGSSL